MSITKDAKNKMNAAIDHLKTELQNIRTGRANPGIVENVMVDAYGASMRIRDLASLSVPEPRQILVAPFDANNASAIGKGIEKANLGFQVVVDGNQVRVVIPAMDESVRNDMVKLCRKRCEEAKVSIRNVRREANDTARKQKSDGDITEDVMNSLEKEIQNLTNDFCNQADEMTSKKEKEVVEI